MSRRNRELRTRNIYRMQIMPTSTGHAMSGATSASQTRNVRSPLPTIGLAHGLTG